LLRLPLDFLFDDEALLLFFVGDLLLDVLAVLGFDAVFERDDDAPDAAFFDVADDERLPPLFVRELPLDFDAVLRPPDELEFARPLPLAFFPGDFFVPDDVPDELLLPPPLVFEPVVERDDDEDFRLAVDLVPLDRPRDVVGDRGTIVSAAAPTAPTAAPAAAPLKISPATSITLLTILEVVDRLVCEVPFLEEPEPFLELDEEDAVAICSSRKCS
jgi:hypothetical protein